MIPIVERWLIGILFIIGICGFCFYKGVDYSNGKWQAREDKAKAEAASEYKAEVEKNADLSVKLAKEEANTKVVYQKIKGEVQHVIEKPIYYQCNLDADGIRLRDSAYDRTKGSSAGTDKPDGALQNTGTNNSNNGGPPLGLR